VSTLPRLAASLVAVFPPLRPTTPSGSFHVTDSIIDHYGAFLGRTSTTDWNPGTNVYMNWNTRVMHRGLLQAIEYDVTYNGDMIFMVCRQ